MENINQNAALICDFMGEQKHTNTEKEINFYGGDFVAYDIQYLKYSSEKIKGKWREPIAIGRMKFNTSWDWLMPVVEKIEAISFDVVIQRDSCDIGNDGNWPVVVTGGGSKIGSVYTAVVHFINWYHSKN